MDVLSACTIWILAGGLSTRMGQDKKHLNHRGRPLLSWILQRSKEFGPPVHVITKDEIRGCGPLSGVHTALKRARTPWNLFLACDMPFVSRELLIQLALAVKPQGLSAFTRSCAGPGFPFILHQRALPLVERRLAGADRSIAGLAEKLKAPFATIVPPQSEQLLNVNTPADWKKARRLWTQLSQSPRHVLHVAGLAVRRGDVDILQHIHWQISPGEHWAILGANGSGKSSLLCALTGYLTPTAGYISLLGKTFGRTDWRELRKQIGLVSSALGKMMADSEFAFETVVSGREAMIDYWGHPTPKERQRASLILRQVECGHLRHRPWLVLSQGERQRVLIGRALMARPRILILDEPCAGLDPAAREHFLQFLQRLGKKRGGPTLVLVTHHVEEIMPVFSHAMILKAGQVLTAGPKQAVLKSNVLAAAFSAGTLLRQRHGRYQLEIAPRTRKVL